jgi:DNA-3-methyladenine glycosylase
VEFRPLRASELPPETLPLARALIGCILVRDDAEGRAAGRIVETEAYAPDDPASHAYPGRRPRTVSMFRGPFHAYVYFIYGVHFCVNVSSEAEGEGAAVLIRALEPLEGIELMARRRGGASAGELCRGPGKLAQALHIDRSIDGRYLLDPGPLWLGAPVRPAGRIGVSRRIGIRLAAERRARFYERGNPFLSGPRSLSP